MKEEDRIEEHVKGWEAVFIWGVVGLLCVLVLGSLGYGVMQILRMVGL